MLRFKQQKWLVMLKYAIFNILIHIFEINREV